MKRTVSELTIDEILFIYYNQESLDHARNALLEDIRCIAEGRVELGCDIDDNLYEEQVNITLSNPSDYHGIFSKKIIRDIVIKKK